MAPGLPAGRGNSGPARSKTEKKRAQPCSWSSTTTRLVSWTVMRVLLGLEIGRAPHAVHFSLLLRLCGGGGGGGGGGGAQRSWPGCAGASTRRALRSPAGARGVCVRQCARVGAGSHMAGAAATGRVCMGLGVLLGSLTPCCAVVWFRFLYCALSDFHCVVLHRSCVLRLVLGSPVPFFFHFLLQSPRFVLFVCVVISLLFFFLLSSFFLLSFFFLFFFLSFFLLSFLLPSFFFCSCLRGAGAVMGKFLKDKKVVIVLSGKYAGKKAVIVKNFDEG